MTDLRETLRRELTGRLGVHAPLDYDTPLFSGGLLDSLSVLELVTLVEKETGKPIPPEEITLENFDTMNKISQFIESLDGRAQS
jgi:acyl carrier protein